MFLPIGTSKTHSICVLLHLSFSLHKCAWSRPSPVLVVSPMWAYVLYVQFTFYDVPTLLMGIRDFNAIDIFVRTNRSVSRRTKCRIVAYDAVVEEVWISLFYVFICVAVGKYHFCRAPAQQLHRIDSKRILNVPRSLPPSSCLRIDELPIKTSIRPADKLTIGRDRPTALLSVSFCIVSNQRCLIGRDHFRWSKK